VAARGCTSIARASAFARAAHSYWLSVFPCARAEWVAWRRHAGQIPDRALREAAFRALATKSDVLEGAVAFAVFVPKRTRPDVVRAIVALEIAFDYLDNIVELPNPDPIRNSRCLCQALSSIAEPCLAHPDYYEHHAAHDDCGYLEALVNTGRAALAKLPSYPVVIEPIKRVLSRIVAYQSLNHGDAEGSYDAFREWARMQSVPATGLLWWEMGAAMGSQLAALALIAAAADPTTRVEDATSIECAYFPWVGALSTLLDSVVDQRTDRAENQRSLIDYYSSSKVTAERLQMLAVEARCAIAPLDDASKHMMILAAMAAFFHSRPQTAAPEVSQTTQAVFNAFGTGTSLAFFFFRIQKALRRISPKYIRSASSNYLTLPPKN
jgi:tetraprenyl-beta-curcumene synthase